MPRTSACIGSLSWIEGPKAEETAQGRRKSRATGQGCGPCLEEPPCPEAPCRQRWRRPDAGSEGLDLGDDRFPVAGPDHDVDAWQLDVACTGDALGKVAAVFDTEPVGFKDVAHDRCAFVEIAAVRGRVRVVPGDVVGQDVGGCRPIAPRASVIEALSEPIRIARAVIVSRDDAPLVAT